MEDQSQTAEMEHFPPEVEFVISALDAGPRPPFDRQKVRRANYRVRATLRLFSDMDQGEPTLLYTRNVSSQAIGFITARPLPLSHGGILELPAPDGTPTRIACTILRCRPAAPGWYEGAVYFNREQPDFAADLISA